MRQNLLDSQTELLLKKKYEGKLFVHIYLLHYSKTFVVNKDYYTVKDGLVYILEKGKLTPSKDTLFDLSLDCIMVGKYNPNKTYKRKIKEYSYSEFKKLHKI